MRFFACAGPAILSLFVSASSGCASSPLAGTAPGARPTSAPTLALAQSSDQADVQGAPKAPLAWVDFDRATFTRAKAEQKLVVLDGAAEWCHWCHVMEATTYHDPAVRQILDAHFIAAKVDVDARPDIEERYGDYGWPATVIFSPDGVELGKYRGYLAPEAFVEILRAVVDAQGNKDRAPDDGQAQAHAPPEAAAKPPLSEDELSRIERMTELELADFYDDENGGWGKWQKAAVAVDTEWLLRRARTRTPEADEASRAQVLFTLEKERALIDPVWGGLYQYSAASDWIHPHFEKLMSFQAGALANYAEAYALTRDPKWLAVARAMRGYIEAFLTGEDGGFYATQDADLNAHEANQGGKPFLNGHAYYALDDAHRRALGIPRVDKHEYGKENGLAIGAFVSFAEATGDASATAAAERAAKRILTTHMTTRGGITHDAGTSASASAILHLADNAAFGFALARLYAHTQSEAYLAAAKTVADFLLRELTDTSGTGGFFASTPDPDAVGVFAARRKPFEDNIAAVRFLARLASIARDRNDTRAVERYRAAIAGTLRAVATPDAIKARGRVLGDFLLALEETRGFR
jgi:uncharacterized protein YyaL (SSP411 family)